MPNGLGTTFLALPTLPFTTSSITGVANVTGQTATTSGGMGRLSCVCDTFQPGVSAYATTALGTSTAFVAPPRATTLSVSVITSSLESGWAIVAPFTPSGAEAYAQLDVFVREFTLNPATGTLTSTGPGVGGPATVVFDVGVFVVGVHIRSRERRTRSAAIAMSVVPGRFYQLWLRSFQYARGWGNFSAGSGAFTYDFGPLTCAFT
jgi:hypothetical protein